MRTHEVVVEDNIHDPVQAVLDMPVGAHGGGERLRGESGGGETIAAFGGDLAGPLGLALDHGDHGQAVEARHLRLNSRNPSKQKLHAQTGAPSAASAASFNPPPLQAIALRGA